MATETQGTEKSKRKGNKGINCKGILVFHFKPVSSETGGVTVLFHPETRRIGMAACACCDMFHKDTGFKKAYGNSFARPDKKPVEYPPGYGPYELFKRKISWRNRQKKKKDPEFVVAALRDINGESVDPNAFEMSWADRMKKYSTLPEDKGVTYKAAYEQAKLLAKFASVTFGLGKVCPVYPGRYSRRAELEGDKVFFPPTDSN